MFNHLLKGTEFRWVFVTSEGNRFGPWVNAHTKKVPFPLSDLELEKYDVVKCLIQSKTGSRIHNHLSLNVEPGLDSFEYRCIASGMIGKLNSRIIGMNIRRDQLVTLSFIFDERI